MENGLEKKSPTASETIKTEVVCPNDTNPMGMLQGGRMVQWMDIAAAVCAQTHSGKICVTVSADHVVFKSSARVGDIITIRATITRTFNTSMEIFVTADARNVLSQETYHVSEAYFTFVALDSQARPTPVIQVRPVTKSQIANYKSALARRKKSKSFGTHG